MSRKLFIFTTIFLVLIGGVLLVKNAEWGTRALWSISNGGSWLLPLVAVSALIDSINPCAFSILLLTIAFLFSLGKLRSKILQIGIFYVLGIFVAYFLIGLGIFQTLHLFNTPHFMAKVGALLLLILGGINIVNEFVPEFPIKLRIPQSAHKKMAELMDKGSLPAVFVLGGLVGLCEFPCTGGPYLMVLGLLHDKATYLQGLGYLALYNVLFVLPLLILLFMASDGKLLSKAQEWQRRERRFMRLGGGVLMIVLGIIIFFV